MLEDLKVTGLTCGGCVWNVTHALKALAGGPPLAADVRGRRLAFGATLEQEHQ